MPHSIITGCSNSPLNATDNSIDAYTILRDYIIGVIPLSPAFFDLVNFTTFSPVSSLLLDSCTYCGTFSLSLNKSTPYSNPLIEIHTIKDETSFCSLVVEMSPASDLSSALGFSGCLLRLNTTEKIVVDVLRLHECRKLSSLLRITLVEVSNSALQGQLMSHRPGPALVNSPTYPQDAISSCSHLRWNLSAAQIAKADTQPPEGLHKGRRFGGESFLSELPILCPLGVKEGSSKLILSRGSSIETRLTRRHLVPLPLSVPHLETCRSTFYNARPEVGQGSQETGASRAGIDDRFTRINPAKSLSQFGH